MYDKPQYLATSFSFILITLCSHFTPCLIVVYVQVVFIWWPIIFPLFFLLIWIFHRLTNREHIGNIAWQKPCSWNPIYFRHWCAQIRLLSMCKTHGKYVLRFSNMFALDLCVRWIQNRIYLMLVVNLPISRCLFFLVACFFFCWNKKMK